MIKYMIIAIICIVLIIIGTHELISAKKEIKEYNEDYDIDSLDALVSTNEAQRSLGWTTEEFYKQRREMYLKQLDSQEKRRK